MRDYSIRFVYDHKNKTKLKEEQKRKTCKNVGLL